MQIERATGLRRQFHAAPELSGHETATAAVIAARLDALGCDVRCDVGGTGVVGSLRGARSGPTIALRADMDALPISEQNGHAHASQVPGVMHACGHDGHSVSLLLAAELLGDQIEHVGGEIRFIFQPAEEVGTGAAAMIADGALAGVDLIFGFHNRPGFELGRVFVKPGPAMAGSMALRITLIGKGGHAAMPHLAINPILAGTALVQALHSLNAGCISPIEPAVLTVTRFSSEAGTNVIPDRAELIVNSRFFSDDAGSKLRAAIGRTARAIGVASGVEVDIEELLTLPPLVNPPDIAEKVAAIARAEFGSQDALIDFIPTMGAEDFAYYLDEVPGCFFFVGNGMDSAYLHSPTYDFRDEILPVAARMFVALALNPIWDEVVSAPKCSGVPGGWQ